ncbi:Probable RNA-directed DNA polymerase from transposon BS [Eumeta japonica]|uniref:Probable RNA-directed DNA polymerase from transposon BS n=1 Tax=Eumeta variegata TaxID=151549 RepID=A0A4C1ZFI0_EUMVA|nr:Probable RNA-directed DNA polymerase from transposon BS [Eumeta japonica]
MEYECPETELDKFVKTATPVARHTNMPASSANSSRAHSPASKNRKPLGKRAASSSSEEDTAGSDSTVVGSDDKSGSGTNTWDSGSAEGSSRSRANSNSDAEKIDTPQRNSIPDDIKTTEQIDHAIGALISHVRTVVEKCERKVPVSSDHRKFPPDILELIRAKNKALRRASAYPTPEYRSRARALQREVKARVQEFRTESWNDLMEEITPSHKAFWKITKALETEGYTPIPLLKRPDGSIALDDVEVAECIADSIKTQCSHASPPHDIAHISRIEEEVLQKTSLEPKDDLTPVSLSEVQTLVKSLKRHRASMAEVIGIHKPGKPRDLPASYRPISLLSGLVKLYERVLKTRLSAHLLGKGLIINEQFGFRPAHSCPQQVLRLVEYVTEGFKSKQKTVAVFFDVAKAFDRVWHTEQEFRKAPPSLPSCTPRTLMTYRDRRPASNSRYLPTIPLYFINVGIGPPDPPSSASRGPLMS